ncbi:phosphomannomutase CpsG [Vibrio sp. TH_r3]|uniref:phosphomannomutase CpsG n=1 Tax=Vibrio sp. TH_r3 TaxID=3082084 RepID=UPI0029539AB2|nr:phosphomannomutase CpsG [Vibrio sp. TH_r3]MDV7102866.1 phosphomannomutase CpsG [Vibrio sp. TH_r3]
MTIFECFTNNDIRGSASHLLTPDAVSRISRAYALHLKPLNVVVGCDGSVASGYLKEIIVHSLLEFGTDVIDLGRVGKEELFYALGQGSYAGGIMVNAAVNSVNCHVLNLIGKNCQPINNSNGLLDIKKMLSSPETNHHPSVVKGLLQRGYSREHYISRLLEDIDSQCFKPMTLVVNSGYGAASMVIDELETVFNQTNVPINFIKINHANENEPIEIASGVSIHDFRLDTAKLVVESGADFGIAWDSDFNRCFIIDDTGHHVPAYYMVGFIAEALLRKNPGSKIVHDHVLYWNTLQTIVANGGVAVATKIGREYFKQKMREVNAIYGGESSAYHYFKDFTYCGSGMIPWLLLIELMSLRDAKLSQLVAEREKAFPISGEIKIPVQNPKRSACYLLEYFKNKYSYKELSDGIGLEFEDYDNAWRLNLRMSTKQQVLKLNVEGYSDSHLVNTKASEILDILAHT